MYIVVGLGNPGEEYKHTRHNVGRMTVDFLEEKKISNIKIVHLDTFMNKSGPAVSKIIKNSGAKAEKLIVIYDDMDLPLGTLKISFNRSSGGHRGLESIIKSIGTEAFIRLRIGITPFNKTGLKKPKGDSEVESFILSDFKKSELEILNSMFKKTAIAVESITKNGLSRAMTECNSPSNL